MSEKNKRGKPRPVLGERPQPAPGSPVRIDLKFTDAGVRLRTKFLSPENGLTYFTATLGDDVACTMQRHMARLGLVPAAGFQVEHFASFETIPPPPTVAPDKMP